MQFFFAFLCVHHFSLDDLQQVTALSKMFTKNTLTKYLLPDLWYFELLDFWYFYC